MVFSQGLSEEVDDLSRGFAPKGSTRVQTGGGMRPSQFIAQVAHHVEAELQAAGLNFQCQARSRLVKFWSGEDSSIHYEVWIHEREARLEIGFHLEANEAHNAALYRELDKCLLDIQVELGGGVWLEPWDKGWVRLYETQSLWPLDSPRVYEIAQRVVAFVTAVQPVYEAICDRLD